MRLEFGLCSEEPTVVHVSAYDEMPGGGVTPVWSDLGAAQPACFGGVGHRTIGPDDPARFQRKLPAVAILGDSLPAGEYHVTLAPRLFEPEFRADGGSVDLEVPAGTAVLRRGGR